MRKPSLSVRLHICCFLSEASALSAALQERKIITLVVVRVKRHLNAAALSTDLKLMSAEAEGRDPWLITEPKNSPTGSWKSLTET